MGAGGWLGQSAPWCQAWVFVRGSEGQSGCGVMGRGTGVEVREALGPVPRMTLPATERMPAFPEPDGSHQAGLSQ